MKKVKRDETNCLSHSQRSSLHELRKAAYKNGDLPHLSTERRLSLIDQFSSFPLGQFILQNQGANGFWTDYILHPSKEILDSALCEVERFILERSPMTIAHRERYALFQKILKSKIQKPSVIASIPCGLMRDLLSLDFPEGTTLVGIDVDPDSIERAQALATSLNTKSFTCFERQDAWNLNAFEKFDAITSSGLNVYESDPTRLSQLYLKFFESLKPGGCLIISVLTVPPGFEKNSKWDLNQIDVDALEFERILFHEILGVKWNNFRSEDIIKEEFLGAGFEKIEIYFDRARIFPTICATKMA